VSHLQVFDERFAEQIRAVEQRQMNGTIDGLGWSDE
jgi:hypothetical protein